VVITPQVQPDKFPSLLSCGDVYLDSIGWSGGNTTLEAVTCGLPVVTLPTGLMRGRHSAAILRRMGLEKFIAATVDEYVALADRLADLHEHTAAAALIVERRERLFRDLDAVRGLEDFLQRAVL